MRVLLLGASGFIGRHILAELSRHGHDVRAVVRRSDGLAAAFPAAEFIAMDLAAATDPADWLKPLAGIDLIVNAAGLLRGRSMDAVHVAMPRALNAACVLTGVERVVLISAISAREGVPTDYARSKLRGEQDLRRSGLRWTILRPSLVYGEGSYGGTSVIRGMAGLPWFVPVPGKGDFGFSPIHVDDLARAVRLLCEGGGAVGETLEPSGPDTLTLREVLGHYRAWLGFGRAAFLSVPMPAMRLLGRLGDLAGGGPVSTNSLVQMIAGNEGDGGAFARSIGFVPRSLDAALAAHPAQVQDRWHARLFFLAPAIRFGLFALWIASALLGLLFGRGPTLELLRAMGAPDRWAAAFQFGSSLLDLAVAALVLLDRRARLATLVQIVVVLGYSIVIGVTLPWLWLDPLGPLLKNLPVLLVILVHGAIGDRR